VKFLLDEMLPPRLAEELRRRDIDTLAVVDAPGLPGTPDSDILEHAASQGRVLVTENIRDFARLHSEWLAQNRSHPGILFVSTKAYPYNRARFSRLAKATEQIHKQSFPCGQIAFL
jgi:predicted nuclease of predicted toxin-antitoxin system